MWAAGKRSANVKSACDVTRFWPADAAGENNSDGRFIIWGMCSAKLVINCTSEFVLVQLEVTEIFFFQEHEDQQKISQGIMHLRNKCDDY